MLISHAGAALRRGDRLQADLGHEPPIQWNNSSGETSDRARTPWRWVAGVTLSGFCGLALIGSALYLDLDRQSYFAARPEFVTAAQPEETGERVNTGKGDRLVRPVDIVAARQDYQVTAPIKVGDKEILKGRPYTLLSTTLTTTPTQFAPAVPPFDPLKTGADRPGKADAPLDVAPPQDDNEVAFTSRDIAPADLAAVSGELSLSQAVAQVAEFVRGEQAGEQRFALAPQLMLMRTSRAGVDPLGALSYAPSGDAPMFPSMTVRMVAENVTSVPRTVEAGADSAAERLLRPKHGQPFEDVLRDNGANPAIAAAILAAFGVRRGESPVADGQKVILQYADAEDPRSRAADRPRRHLQRRPVALFGGGQGRRQLRCDLPRRQRRRRAPRRAERLRRRLEPVPEPLSDRAQTGAAEARHRGVRPRLRQRRRLPARRAARRFDDRLRRRRRRIRAALDPALRDDDGARSDLPLLSVPHARRQSPSTIYDENGRSTRKFLIRKPIADGELTSGFGMRYHPILHFSRMQPGSTGRAPIGTPILAAGNGVVIKAGWDSGYGRRVEIQHANGYVTTYNHMSGFGRGIRRACASLRGRWSAISARPASRPVRTCITK